MPNFKSELLLSCVGNLPSLVVCYIKLSKEINLYVNQLI